MPEQFPQQSNTPEQPEKEKLPFATPECENELKRIIQAMNSVHPDVIFFTMTSAFNVAVVLKEVWKVAYPNEDIPMFYGINPRDSRSIRGHTIIMDNFREKLKK
jgi:hypothetical protein